MTTCRPVRFVLLIVCLFATLPSSHASAQGEVWVVPVWEPSAEGSSDSVLAVTNSTEAALTAAGVSVAPDDAMQRVFEENVSSPATQLTQTEIDRWVSRSRSALRNLARADYDAARTDLLEAQQISQDAAEELNREAAGARNVLDTCLYMVRAYLETGDRESAERQTRQCRQQVPNVQPSELQHTPEVVELLANTAPAVTGRLSVTSDPTGCAVRINGVWNGETPFEIDRLQHGQYRLQVECDPSVRGRVHRIEIGDERLRVHVTADYDAAFASRPVRGFSGAARFAPRLAEEVGRTVLLVTDEDGAVTVRRFDPGTTASSVVRVDGSTPMDDPLRALREGRSLDFTVSPPREIQSGVGSVAGQAIDDETLNSPGSSLPTGRWILGLGLIAAGATTVALATIPHHNRSVRGDQYLLSEIGDSDFIDRQELWLNLRRPVIALSLVGGAMAAAGLSLLVKERESVPWYAWVAGGVGVAVGGVALIHYLSAGGCDNLADDQQECIDQGQAGGRAAMLGAVAMPLVAWPIAALLRRTDIDLSVSVAPGAVAWMLRGEFE